MEHPRRQYLIILSIVFVFLLSGEQELKGQTFRFQNFDSNVGLPQNFVYAIEQDDKGYIWMGTGEGLVRYNGLEFESFNESDSLAGDFVNTLHLDDDGNLWIGHNKGDFTVFRDGEFTPLRIPETKSPVQAIKTDNTEYIWALVQNTGLIRVNKETLEYSIMNHSGLEHKFFYSLITDHDNTLIGTSEGLFRAEMDQNKDSISSVSRVEEIPMTNITALTSRKGIRGDYWVGTEDNGFFVYSSNSKGSRQIVDNSLCLKFDIQRENIRHIEEEPNGNLLLGTWGNGVIKLFYDPDKDTYVDSYNFTEENGLSNNHIREILLDRESNYWFATYGGGTSLLTDESMVHYNLKSIGFENNKVLSSFRHDSTLWLGLENGLIKTDPFCFTDFEYYDSDLGIPNDEITGIHRSPDGTIFVASGNNGIYFREPGEIKFQQWRYTSHLPGLKIRDMVARDDTIYLATYEGFFVLNTVTRETNHLTTDRGLPHNNINFVFTDDEENIWIGPKSNGICKLKDDRIEVHKIAEEPIDIYDMTQTSDGSIWLASHGKGVIKYEEDTIQHYNVNDGLAKNFCYSIETDHKDRLWVAHHPGLSMINTQNGHILTYGHEENMGSDFGQLRKDTDGTLWFSAAQGAVHYFPKKDDINEVPPVLHFTNIRISDEEYQTSEDIDLPYPYGKNYQFYFQFIGISFEKPRDVTYQYQLVNTDNDESPKWIDLGNTRFREYDFLPSGNYELKVRAFNADGIASDPVSVSFTIATPFWKKPWFYIVLFAVIIYTVYLIIIFRERKLRKQKEILQREVDLQTIQLREQKAEIERKNRDITDSINYAKTIQSSILPPLNVLKNYFPESFVFFVPRDIVSGDFYWFYKTKTHFLICCADCTGHGVPGAFMSMIGTTLLNDIVKRKDVNSPADLLERLDLEIKVLLQNSKNKDNTRDGMDISVVEIDPGTRRVRVASAKRPVYLYLSGELTLYKGHRRSIGDSLVDNDAPFVNMEYQCRPKDLIYLFSDGYSDQFGGPNEKKFMKVGVKNMLENIHSLKMEDQHQAVSDQFYSWKGDLEQVDDVIFIGIQL
ncbi:MAG: two-component regulator propeller domain-containing protein [Marinilabilia sp.]